MLSGLMNVGKTALNAAQAWISVTGSNIANADTEGYTRRYVDQRDAGTLVAKPGGEGLGVNAQQVLRYFNSFLESSYVRQSTNSARWEEQENIMGTLESLFNESNRAGISSSMNAFFTAWQKLAQRPGDTASREDLLSYADNLCDMLGNTATSVKALQSQMDVSINQSVSRVNELAKSIASLNKQINATTIDGVSNPNDLLDQRDQLVREMATYVDVKTMDSGGGNFTVALTTGQPLVQGVNTNDLEIREPRAENRLSVGSPYTGSIQYDGSDSHEYTIDIVSGGNAGPAGTAGNPTFRVSLDGGKTWLRDENGNEQHYEISSTGTSTDPVQVKNLKISFDSTSNFTVGDKFDIIPKTGLYWIEPTRGPQNVTPQVGFDGTDTAGRVSGGKLTTYFNIRDDNCGRYMDELDATAKSLIWEVNRIHSQGAGTSLFDFAQGQQGVSNTTVPLGSAQAVLPESSRLQAGNVNFYFYNKTSGDYVSSGQLDFSAITPGTPNFDPSKHSLDDVVSAINSSFPGELTATIQDGKLVLNTAAGSNLQFALGTDSTGMMAALGVNTFFTGTTASDIATSRQLHDNENYIAAGQVNGQQQINKGDNATATAIGKLASTNVTISTAWKTTSNQTIGQYYASLVTTVGADTRFAKTNSEYHKALTSDLSEQVSSASGVNLDEEMANLIKYQHSYTAAAKLITTADQMLQTLLGLKQ
ncbi:MULTISPECIES: flagellar hook-associated protein FlgK [Desulfovibrio]|uniref:Flagellar hook-associated protein 1 n=2 Tax=root TaxID=1 RepID=A0A212JIW8_9BACT|nr:MULTISPECIES: flagellar hook-associated protein FlgK [Desulfovibrio]MBT9747626.1 flagellar hook-associated protein FlgK [Desulfovibrio desulfuricans]MCB6541703.1 flagellar hook-associated protein FlgK [Desulfovibrio desulfuricans]MCB6552784.1 flagellar hook-associated protein FlgK [Desulfovibrio desulfuricans]MCB6564594.1 flagellar hook-associated protein FlgK [Desulfovibrio desulfuricans]MCB7345809.1 flagellar hook-associated protein FlgK [Desulfovibrio desulfuricans]